MCTVEYICTLKKWNSHTYVHTKQSYPLHTHIHTWVYVHVCRVATPRQTCTYADLGTHVHVHILVYGVWCMVYVHDVSQAGTLHTCMHTHGCTCVRSSYSTHMYTHPCMYTCTRMLCTLCSHMHIHPCVPTSYSTHMGLLHTYVHAYPCVYMCVE